MAIKFIDTDLHYLKTLGYKGVLGNQSRTVCFWIKGSFDFSRLWWHWGNTANGQQIYLMHYLYGGVDLIMIGIGYGYRMLYPGDAFDGDWHLITMVQNGTNVVNCNIYCDVTLLGLRLQRAYGINTVANYDVHIATHGTLGASYFLDADMFDFRMYSRALAFEEVEAIYNDGNGCDGIVDDLELRLEMRKESGIVTIESDTSGNERDATAYNEPSYVEDPFNSCGKLLTNRFNRIEGGMPTCLN